MGIVSKAVAKSADVKAEVYFAELNWNAIMSLALGRNVTYAPLPKTQPVKRDLALLIDSSVTMEQIEQVVRKSEKRLLRSVELFDVYEGKNLPEGKKSYAISIALQDDEKLCKTNTSTRLCRVSSTISKSNSRPSCANVANK